MGCDNTVNCNSTVIGDNAVRCDSTVCCDIKLSGVNKVSYDSK